MEEVAILNKASEILQFAKLFRTKLIFTKFPTPNQVMTNIKLTDIITDNDEDKSPTTILDVCLYLIYTFTISICLNFQN